MPGEQPTHQVIIFADEKFEGNKEKPLPQKSITIRMAHSKTGESIKIIRNSDYTGEGWKKGVFAGEDWRVKRDGKAIFLHAGCRQDRLVGAWGSDPKPQVQNSLFVALSANGKTSLVCRVLAKKEGEESWLVQDDGGTLRDDGSFTGFEAGGLFVKTEKLNPSDQIETYYAVLRPGSYLENVYVDEDGRIDFYNLQRTANGRAIVEREDLMHSSQEISVEKIHNLFIITRGNIFPAMAQLTPEQATAWMIRGQSTESSAGDPTQAGKIIEQFFFDPFVAGDRTEHANLFYEIIKRNGIKCYHLNTGGIGEGEAYQKITLQETLGILDSTLRGGLEDWIEDEGTGLMIPVSVRTVDSSLFHPQKLFPLEVFAQKQREFNQQGAEILEEYPDLEKKVREVFLR